MTIRQATAQDVPRLIELGESFVIGSVYRELLPVVDPARLRELAHQVLEVGVIFVAEVEGVVRGAMALVPVQQLFDGEHYAEELFFWVEASHQNGTLGVPLLRAAECWALEQQLAYLHLACPFQDRTGEWYYVQGYRPLETTFIKRLMP